MDRDGLAVALSRRVGTIRRGGGGGDGDSDDDSWDLSDSDPEDDWGEDEEEEEMGFGLFDEVSEAIYKPLVVGSCTTAKLTDAKKPTVTLNELNTIFNAQGEVRFL